MKIRYPVVLLLGIVMLLACSCGGGGGGGGIGGNANAPQGNTAGAPGGNAATTTGTSNGTHTNITQPSIPSSSYTVPIDLSTKTASIPSGLESYVTVTASTETVNSTSTNLITVTSTSSAIITYKLSGTLTNGMFYIKNSSADYIIELNGATISSSVTPAMLLKKGTAYIVTDSGTTNTFSDNRNFTSGADYGEYDQKGAIHTTKDMVLSGSGTLKVANASYKSGIYSKGILSVIGGTINVTSTGNYVSGGIGYNNRNIPADEKNIMSNRKIISNNANRTYNIDDKQIH